MGQNIVVRSEEIKPLSVPEASRLEQLETVIAENMQGVFNVGYALAEIRERNLYREKTRTFEQYVKQVFDIARGTAHRYIKAAEFLENVSNWRQNDGDVVIDMLPTNESQIRPLTKLKPEQQVVVWRSVVEKAKHSAAPKITASLVNNVVKKYLGEKVTSTIRRSQAKVDQAQVSADFAAAFKAFSDQILKEKLADYKFTSRGEIVAHLDQIRADIAEDGEYIDEPAVHGGASDTNKLLRAGFVLFRPDHASKTIKIRTDSGWAKHSGPYETIKAMDAELAALMQEDNHLRG